jgi:type III pantothenate kinase
MSACASLLPKVTIEAPAHPIMAGTIECMQSGLVFGAAAMVDGMLARFYEQLGYTPTVLATGGLAPSIAPHCREKLILDENLILDGLRILFEKNER